MKCSTARQYVDAELDGELPAAQKTALDEHLRACGACRTMRSQLLAIRSAMQRLAEVSEPARTSPSPIPFSPVGRIYRPAAPVWAWAAAAVFVLCVAGWMTRGLWHQPLVHPSTIARQQETPPTAIANAQPQPSPRQEAAEVTIQTPPDTIVVPYPTRNPKVTIYWLYPVQSTARNPEPADRDTDRPL